MVGYEGSLPCNDAKDALLQVESYPKMFHICRCFVCLFYFCSSCFQIEYNCYYY